MPAETQTAVDSAHQVFLPRRAAAKSLDKPLAVPMIQEPIHNIGRTAGGAADARCYSTKEVQELSALGVDPLVAARKTPHNTVVTPPCRETHLSPRDCLRP